MLDTEKELGLSVFFRACIFLSCPGNALCGEGERAPCAELLYNVKIAFQFSKASGQRFPPSHLALRDLKPHLGDETNPQATTGMKKNPAGRHLREFPVQGSHLNTNQFNRCLLLGRQPSRGFRNRAKL